MHHLLPIATSLLLLLLSIAPTATEVVESMAACPGFLLNETPPRVPGVLEGGNIQNQNRYKPVCQTLGSDRHFVTLYDIQNKIPVFSAYRYRKVVFNGRPITRWKIEPQLENLFSNNNMEDSSKSETYHHQAGNTDYTGQGFDRGHLLPSSYGSTKIDKMSTFTLTNVVPQEGTFNKGSWARMEKCTKCVLDKYCINSNDVIEGYLVIGAQPSSNNVMGEKRINIPSLLWSAFCCYSSIEGDWLASAHWGQNVPDRSKHLETKTLAELQRELRTPNSAFEVFPGTRCPLSTTVTRFYSQLDSRCDCPPTSSTTSAPPTTTSTASPSTSAPLSTTSAPLSTTSAPLSTTSAPLSTTSAPLSTTSAPLTTTSAPLSTTSAPLSTTSAPLTTTSAPLSTTSAPLSTTSAPLSTTSAPLSTTSAPLSTTSAPLSTTSAPLTTTSAPLTTTSATTQQTTTEPTTNTQTTSATTTTPTTTSTTTTTKRKNDREDEEDEEGGEGGEGLGLIPILIPVIVVPLLVPPLINPVVVPPIIAAVPPIIAAVPPIAPPIPPIAPPIPPIPPIAPPIPPVVPPIPPIAPPIPPIPPIAPPIPPIPPFVPPIPPIPPFVPPILAAVPPIIAAVPPIIAAVPPIVPPIAAFSPPLVPVMLALRFNDTTSDALSTTSDSSMPCPAQIAISHYYQNVLVYYQMLYHNNNNNISD